MMGVGRASSSLVVTQNEDNSLYTNFLQNDAQIDPKKVSAIDDMRLKDLISEEAKSLGSVSNASSKSSKYEAASIHDLGEDPEKIKG